VSLNQKKNTHTIDPSDQTSNSAIMERKETQIWYQTNWSITTNICEQSLYIKYFPLMRAALLPSNQPDRKCWYILVVPVQSKRNYTFFL